MRVCESSAPAQVGPGEPAAPWRLPMQAGDLTGRKKAWANVGGGKHIRPRLCTPPRDIAPFCVQSARGACPVRTIARKFRDEMFLQIIEARSERGAAENKVAGWQWRAPWHSLRRQSDMEEEVAKPRIGAEGKKPRIGFEIDRRVSESNIMM
jgi:hypothetical protein